MDRERDSHTEILNKEISRSEKREECRKSVRLLQIYDRTLKKEEQREVGTCRIKAGKLGISAM